MTKIVLGPLAPTRARRADREPEPGTRDARESRERARPSDARVAPARRETARERARLCVPRPRVDPTGLLRGECRISNMSAPATRARGAAPTWDEEVDFPNEALQSETESDSAVSARRIAPRAPRSTPAHILANFLFVVGPRPRPLSSRAPRPPTARPRDAIARPLTPRPVPSQPAERRRGRAMDARSPDRTRGSRGDRSRIAAQPCLGRQRARRGRNATD